MSNFKDDEAQVLILLEHLSELMGKQMPMAIKGAIAAAYDDINNKLAESVGHRIVSEKMNKGK